MVPASRLTRIRWGLRFHAAEHRLSWAGVAPLRQGWPALRGRVLALGSL